MHFNWFDSAHHKYAQCKQSLKFSLRSNYKQRGIVQIIVVVLILIVVLTAGGVVYYTKQIKPTPTPTPDSMVNWKTYTGSGINSGITFQHPASIQIDVYKYNTQLYVGYTNQEWFNKLASLKSEESFSDQREKRTKLDSGKVESGQNYVIFRDELSAGAQSENFNQFKAYVLNNQTIVQIVLPDSNVTVFKKILSTFKFAD